MISFRQGIICSSHQCFFDVHVCRNVERNIGNQQLFSLVRPTCLYSTRINNFRFLVHIILKTAKQLLLQVDSLRTWRN